MANSTILYACISGGLAIFNRPGTLPEWLPPRIVLEGQEVTSVWGEPGPPIRVLTATNGMLMLSENGGRTWVDVALPSGNIDSPVMALFYEQSTRLLFAARYNGHLAMSTDQGATWEPLPSLPTEGCPLSLQLSHKPGTANHYYLLHGESERNVFYLGNPNQGDWHEPTNDTLKEHEPCALSVDPISGKLYALAPGGVLTIDIADEGEKEVSAKLLVGSPTNGQAIAVIPGSDPTQPAIVVGTPDGLWTSGDGGNTWQAAQLPGKGEVTAIDRDPERRDRLYAATDTGYIFESGNRGQTWQPVNHIPTHSIQFLYVLRI